MNKVTSLDGTSHKTTLQCHKSNNARTFFMRSPHQTEYLLLLFYSQYFSFWFSCADVFPLTGAVTLNQQASLYTASNSSLYITAGIIESDDKIKSDLRVPGTLWWFTAFALFIKLVHIFRGGLVWNMESGGLSYEAKGNGILIPWCYHSPLPAGERRRHRQLLEVSACYVGRNGQQHPWDPVWGKKEQQKDNACEYASQG